MNECKKSDLTLEIPHEDNLNSNANSNDSSEF
jgi:hypothetical protein